MIIIYILLIIIIVILLKPYFKRSAMDDWNDAFGKRLYTDEELSKNMFKGFDEKVAKMGLDKSSPSDPKDKTDD